MSLAETVQVVASYMLFAFVFWLAAGGHIGGGDDGPSGGNAS